ncbi:BrnT family toxin [Cypionkella psychrotolerans]|uniref:BrnT family toxin n=1 Tax=Cypionkella psychrotolerans TaxID=1678131 RepID=UPI0006B52E03|nr:BrnT family toxin [Cypionkella psychrotolerans]
MWDWVEPKRKATLLLRGPDFAMVESMDLDLAEVSLDDRKDYGEIRLQARGLIDGRLYVIAFTQRGESLRLISLRKASKREQVLWENR